MRLALGIGQGRQQQASKDRDYGDHDQQLDQSESLISQFHARSKGSLAKRRQRRNGFPREICNFCAWLAFISRVTDDIGRLTKTESHIMKIKTLGTLAAATLLSVSLNTVQAEKDKAVTDKTPANAAKKSDRPTDRPTRESIIKRFDKDGDGKLSDAERAAARKAFGSRGSRGSRGGRTPDRAPGRISEGLRARYEIASKKIQADLKAGKITEAQARERQQALRKRLAQSSGRGGDRDSDRSGSSREGLMKEFDKNKDGKLDEAERNALRKAMTERFRSRGGEGAERGRRGGESAERGSERRRRGGEGAERRRRGGEGSEGGENRRRGRRNQE